MSESTPAPSDEYAQAVRALREISRALSTIGAVPARISRDELQMLAGNLGVLAVRFERLRGAP